MIAVSAATTPITISDVPKERLVDCTAVMQRAFGFSDLDATPPAMLYTHALFGGINLGAFEGGTLVGWVPAFPAYRDGKVFLFSAGLSVSPERQSGGLGGMLMTALGQAARDRGFDCIRWTTNIVSSRNLYLYLAKCGAELTGYAPLMYHGLNDSASSEGVEGDEVEIEWDITGPTGPRSANGGGRRSAVTEREALTRTDVIGDGLRCLRETGQQEVGVDRTHAVEVPWDAEALAQRDPELVTNWRRGLGTIVAPLVDRGYRGVDVLLDRAERRSFVIFEPSA